MKELPNPTFLRCRPSQCHGGHFIKALMQPFRSLFKGLRWGKSRSAGPGTRTRSGRRSA